MALCHTNNMKLTDLISPMSNLTQDQRDVSNSVVGGSLALLGVVMVAAMPLPAQADGRMYGEAGGYTVPTRPAPAPAPAPQPTYTPTPAPAPAPTAYGVFRPYGPLAEGRVRVVPDNTFRWTEVFGFTAAVQDNGEQGNDQIWVDGPEGVEHIWANCWVTEEWKSYGPNSEGFIDAVVSSWCGWE